MKSTLTIGLLLVAATAHAQGPSLTVSATLTKTSPGEWTLSGVVANAGMAPYVQVFAREAARVDGSRLDRVWMGTFVRADGSWSLTFTAPAGGVALEVYTVTAPFDPRRQGRTGVLVP